MNINYSASIFTFKGHIKHVLFDTSYYITVFADYFVMGESANHQYPKYQYTITMDTKVGWIVATHQGNQILTGFEFEYRGKFKVMNCQHSSLIKLREFLANRVTFINIRANYTPDTMLAYGSSAKVYKTRCCCTNITFAIKAIIKEEVQTYDAQDGFSLFTTEVKILKQLREFIDGFPQLYEIYQSETNYYLILNYLQGRNLMKEMKKKSSKITSPQIKQIMKKLLINLSNLHSKDIIHRDLKPGNLMFARKRDYSSLTLIDFGLSTYEDAYPYVFPKCGTPGYLAPEIANYKDNDRYSTKVDMYSVGCIFFELLTGNNLFMGSDQKSIWKQNKQFDVNIQLPIDNVYITEQSLDLLNSLLQFNPKDRISAKQALQHQYFEINMEASTLKQSLIQSPINLSPAFEQSCADQDYLIEDSNEPPYPIFQDSNLKGPTFDDRTYQKQYLP